VHQLESIIKALQLVKKEIKRSMEDGYKFLKDAGIDGFIGS